uniref:T-cell surface glycoprotein CD1a-like n=1 Tax=Callospermophilus lateralis TaxID=76772 RepID=UPI004038976C
MARFKEPVSSHVIKIIIFDNHSWIQMAAGCELGSVEDFIDFLQIAVQGTDFWNFKNESWLPSPKMEERAQQVSGRFHLNRILLFTWHRLLSDTCPRFTWGLLDAVKAQLQRQVKPETWMSSGPSPGPGRLLLVCHASVFYPKPVWVMWMRREQEQLGTQRGDILPNADGMWHLQATLDVAAGEAAGLACRVKHSSLGGQDLVLYWGGAQNTGLWAVGLIAAGNHTPVPLHRVLFKVTKRLVTVCKCKTCGCVSLWVVGGTEASP